MITENSIMKIIFSSYQANTGISLNALEKFNRDVLPKFLLGLIQDKIKTDENSLDADEIPALVAFRCTFLLFFFTVLLSWNTYGWRNAGVNHILIFEIDPRNHLNYLQLLTV